MSDARERALHERYFYERDASPRASWRLAVLMGRNSRTYKFGLGRTLLDFGREGRDAVPLTEFAAAYALNMAHHMGQDPQAPRGPEPGPRDFLTVAADERAATVVAGRATERLVDAAVRSIPGMVMKKFHNLADDTVVPHTFYALVGRGRHRTVTLSPDLVEIAGSEQAPGLAGELEARWRIVESSFAAEVGRSLIAGGVEVDLAHGVIRDKLRRRAVTGVVEATIGFQHGRCLICDEVIAPGDAVAVDHVFPFALMKRYGSIGGWSGPDLDALWNLAPAHQGCNSLKSDRPPTRAELIRLAARNEAIAGSPHPLRRTLELSLGGAASWEAYLAAVERAAG
ncbi:HNH endonuclease signature motif containing protein [Streptomyces sp. NPDC001941]|uniref:HNH endonuclease n=1 Tax=Streptomyces sp. NPDC001941 TaxID=3154659 RepID=UPI00332138C0